MIELPRVFDVENDTNEFLVRMKRRAAKNFKWSREPSLRAAADLAYWLHLFHRDDDALELCEFLSAFEFADNFRHWSWVENALALGARLHRQRGNTQAAVACVDRIRQTRFVEDRLSGALLDENYGRLLDHALREGTPADERNSRLIYIAEVCVMNELGGSETYPPSVLEALYKENAARLRELVDAPAS